MTDNRTTELLRKLLDERGVEWWESRGYGTGIVYTFWHSPTFGRVHAIENDDGTLFMACLNNCDFTPEQAIAATLGSEREKQLELLVNQLWYLVNHRSGYGYAAALEAIEELEIEVDE